jgi:hypothetical protein
LTLPTIVTTAGQELKIDSVAEVEVTTGAGLPNYQYTITYVLLNGATPLATITAEKDHDQASAASRVYGEILNLTWVDAPTAGAQDYSIQITVTGTNLTSAEALTRALNAVIFG